MLVYQARISAKKRIYFNTTEIQSDNHVEREDYNESSKS